MSDCIVQLMDIVFAEQNPEHHERSRWLKVVGLVNTFWGTRSEQKCWIAHFSKWPLYFFPHWHPYRHFSFCDFCPALTHVGSFLVKHLLFVHPKKKKKPINFNTRNTVESHPHKENQKQTKKHSQHFPEKNEGKCDIMYPQVFMNMELPKLDITLFSCLNSLHWTRLVSLFTFLDSSDMITNEQIGVRMPLWDR